MILAAFAGLAATDVKAPVAAKAVGMDSLVTSSTRGGLTVSYNQTFTKDAAWNSANLFGAVFIQDQTYTTKKDQSGAYNWKSAEVLQAAMVKLDGTQFSTGSERYVLFELATGEWCGYCPAADGSLDRIVDDSAYFPAKCVPITWHNGDTYSNTDSDSRNNAYVVPGFPTAFFDGTIAKVGGGTTSSSTVNDAAYKSNIDTRKAVSSPFKITVKGDISGSNGWLNATCEKVGSTTISNVNVFLVVVEDLDTTYVHGSDNVPLRHTGRKILLKQPLDISNTPPEVSLTANLNGQTIEGTQAITWTASDNEDLASALSIKLQYKQGSGNWTDIAITTNTGTYNWDTTALADGEGYNIRVGATDSGAITTWATGIGTFTIDNPDPPTVSLTYPTADLTILGNVTVTWTSSDPEDAVGELKASLYYSTNGATWHPIVENITNTGSYIWDTNTVDDGTNYKVMVVIWDTTGLSAFSINLNTFTIDNLDNPLISLTTALEGTTVSGEQLLQWTASDQEDTPNEMRYSLYLSSNGGTTWTAVFEEKTYPTQYKLDTTVYPNGQYLLKVQVKDTTDLIAEDVTNAPFTIYNNDPPALTLKTPVSGKSYDGILNITYTATDKQDALKDLNVSIYYSADASDWTAIIENAAAKGFYAWDISGVANGDYFVNVIVTDKVSATAEAQSDAFTIDNDRAPIISAFSPKGGETIKGEFAITWKATDPNKDELKITIQAQSCSGGICGLFEDLAADLANTGSYTVRSGVLAPAEYNFKIIAREVRTAPLETFVITSDYVNIVGTNTTTSDDDTGDDDTTTDDDTGGNDTNNTDDDTSGNGTNGDKGSNSPPVLLIILIIAVLVIGAVVIALVLVMKKKSKNMKSQKGLQTSETDVSEKNSATPPMPAQQAPAPQPTPQAAPGPQPAYQQPQPARPVQYKAFNPPQQAQPAQQMAAPNQPNSLPQGGGAPQGQLALPPAQSAPGPQAPAR